MSDADDEKWAIMAVLAHLKAAADADAAKHDALQEAIMAISNAYALNMFNAATKQRYPLDGLALPAVYKAGRSALLASTSASAPAPASASADDAPAATAPRSVPDQPPAAEPDARELDDGFDKFVALLKRTTNVFNGLTPGSAEYEQRLEQARQKYESKRATKKQRVQAPDSSTPAATSASASAFASASASASASAPASAPDAPRASEEARARAATIKNRGNAQLKAKQYEAALSSYSECIALDPGNAVYFSNRAAAEILLSRFTEAVDDCKRAIALDASFVRPRERLASAYRYLGMTRNEIDALTGALALDPENAAFRTQLTDAEARLARENAGGAPAAGGAGGGGGGGGAGAGAGGLGIDANVLSSMARSFGVNLPDGLADSVANSDMMSQVGNMMRDNPGMVQQMMQAFMGGAGGPGGAAGGGRGPGAGSS